MGMTFHQISEAIRNSLGLQEEFAGVVRRIEGFWIKQSYCSEKSGE
jgi:hypothetical protein